MATVPVCVPKLTILEKVPAAMYCAPLLEMPATYTGHAVAGISNNGAQYIAAGTFSNIVNFGTQTGTVAINGLDNTNYAGSVSLSTSATFAGGLAALGTSGRSINLYGQFFQGGPTNSTPLYGEMGGTLSIAGPNNYLGGGIFLGRKP